MNGARAGETHPVWDFLFSYYTLRPGQLRRRHPGYGVVLGGDAAQKYVGRSGYRPHPAGVGLRAHQHGAVDVGRNRS
jgi:hypothetical protein